MHSTDRPPDLTPLILLVDGEEQTANSLESALRPRGNVVLKAPTGRQALDLVQKVSPDAILVAVRLPDFDGIDLLRRLRESPTIHRTTPKLIMSTGALGKAERLEALSAGAWDLLIHPVDPGELVVRLETFVQAKHEADRVRDEGLTDVQTGLYNVRGVLRRTKELAADAARSERPITCVTFGGIDAAERSQSMGDDYRRLTSPRIGEILAEALKGVTRVSDTIGMLGPGEFVVLAPGTGEDGALRLADRVFEALDASEGGVVPEAAAKELQSIRAGLYTATTEDTTTAEDLLLRATMALRKAQTEDGSFRARSYEA